MNPISDDMYDRLMSGEDIYGDQFTVEEIEAWYRDEEAASFENYEGKDTAQYDALNWEYAFRFLAKRRFQRCLAIGTADGRDVEPLAPFVDEFIAIEPEQRWWRSSIGGCPASFRKPTVRGEIDLPVASVDLAVCLSVLHHVPNVSFVLEQIGRVMRPSGVLILREPITSMGDWRLNRPRMTRRERGLPLKPLLQSVREAGFELSRVSTFDCPLVPRGGALLGVSSPYNKPLMIALDKLLSFLFRWNLHYNPKNAWQKISPSSVFVVASRNERADCLEGRATGSAMGQVSGL